MLNLANNTSRRIFNITDSYKYEEEINSDESSSVKFLSVEYKLKED